DKPPIIRANATRTTNSNPPGPREPTMHFGTYYSLHIDKTSNILTSPRDPERSNSSTVCRIELSINLKPLVHYEYAEYGLCHQRLLRLN
ncbi:hypothetical protein TNCT_78561, partial [Trichonephila clavata]